MAAAVAVEVMWGREGCGDLVMPLYVVCDAVL